MGSLLSLCAVLGLLWGLAGKGKPIRKYLEGHLGSFMAASGVAIVLQLLLVARFGLLYAQAQGRFLFPLLVPIALLTAIGFELLGARRISGQAHIHAVGFFIVYAMGFTGFSIGWFWTLGPG